MKHKYLKLALVSAVILVINYELIELAIRIKEN